MRMQQPALPTVAPPLIRLALGSGEFDDGTDRQLPPRIPRHCRIGGFVSHRLSANCRRSKRADRCSYNNSDVEKVLIRRIVLESYTPRMADVTRLLEGKARDMRVRVSDLLGEAQVLNVLFTRILETDFITQEQRTEILGRLNPLLVEAEQAPIGEAALHDVEVSRRRLLQRTLTSAALALVTSVAGSLIAFLPNLRDLGDRARELLPALVATVGASLGVIGTWLAIARLRESQEDRDSKVSAVEDAIQFEQEVLKTLAGLGLKPVIPGRQDRGYDLMITHGGGKILVEIKSWRRPVPMELFERVAETLVDAVRRQEASEGIVVSRTPLRETGTLMGPLPIRFMSLREFRNYLVHMPSAGR